MNDKERIVQIEAELAELRARMPRHSVPPTMIIEMEDLEEELETLRSRVDRDSD